MTMEVKQMVAAPAAEPIFEKSVPGRRASQFPGGGFPRSSPADSVPEHLLRAGPAGLPEVSELDLVRHFTNLSRKNWAIDVGAYPLGSCTMKYNPKIHDQIAALPGFRRLHPWQDSAQTQGALRVLWELEQALAELTGMSRVTFQPAAGAAGELTALLMIRAFHEAAGDARTTVLIPDSAHGTNPATVTLAGYRTRQIPSNAKGLVDLEALKAACDGSVAALMLTNPNTLGRFEEEIEEVAAAVHDAGGLLYYDGANLNAIMGVVRPGDMGFDLVHMNLHKTFTTPHGSGGPGSGPVAAGKRLERFLPAPLVGRDESGGYFWDLDRPDSIGQVHGFHGNFAVALRAWAYIRCLGGSGLREVSERAVLNAAYLRSLIEDAFPMSHPGPTMHEFVSTARPYKNAGIRAFDVAKRLIDLGFHPPTVYFPKIAEEALMIEPTETESRQTLDALAGALLQIAAEARDNPDLLHQAPVTTPVGRLDEATAARTPRLRWRPD